jgi:hypothetical protein
MYRKQGSHAVRSVSKLDSLLSELEEFGDSLDEFPKLRKRVDNALDKLEKVADVLRVRRSGNLIIFPGLT